MSIFNHHLYEYKKGLRNLVLHTGSANERDLIEKKLKNGNISYYIQKVSASKINVFFGSKECIEIVKCMENRLLSTLTEEEDFMLGIMLGYDRLEQCKRYIRRKQCIK